MLPEPFRNSNPRVPQLCVFAECLRPHRLLFAGKKLGDFFAVRRFSPRGFMHVYRARKLKNGAWKMRFELCRGFDFTNPETLPPARRDARGRNGELP